MTLFRNVFHALGKDGFHMAVGQRVENGFSLPAAFHQSALLENPKLVGHGALIHADQLGKIADAQLVLASGITLR